MKSKLAAILGAIALTVILGACAMPPGAKQRVIERCPNGDPYAVMVYDGQHVDYDEWANSSDYWHRETRWVKQCGGQVWIETPRRSWHRFLHCNHNAPPQIFCDNPFHYEVFIG